MMTENIEKILTGKQMIKKAKELARLEVESGRFRPSILNDEIKKLMKNMPIGDGGISIERAYERVLSKGREALS